MFARLVSGPVLDFEGPWEANVCHSLSSHPRFNNLLFQHPRAMISCRGNVCRNFPSPSSFYNIFSFQHSCTMIATSSSCSGPYMLAHPVTCHGEHSPLGGVCPSLSLPAMSLSLSHMVMSPSLSPIAMSPSLSLTAMSPVVVAYRDVPVVVAYRDVSVTVTHCDIPVFVAHCGVPVPVPVPIPVPVPVNVNVNVPVFHLPVSCTEALAGGLQRSVVSREMPFC